MKITSLALMLLTLGSAFAYGTTGDKTITKVVKLLQDMLDKSKTEGDEEVKIYAKFKCYCDQSEAEKNKAVADNTKLISLLESEVEELQGSNGELSSKCADLKASKAANKMQRSEAKTIRDKEHKQFIADTTDFEQAIRQMEQAIRTLTAVGADQTKSTGADNKQFMAGHKGASLFELAGVYAECTCRGRVIHGPEAISVCHIVYPGTLHWHLHIAVWSSHGDHQKYARHISSQLGCCHRRREVSTQVFQCLHGGEDRGL